MWLKVIAREEESEDETSAHEAIIFEGIANGGMCLEIGAGVGRLLKRAAKRFKIAMGVDYSQPLARISNDYLHGTPNAWIFIGDGWLLPCFSGTVDFVYSYTCFHHMPKLEIVKSNIRETYRVLKSGGVCRIHTLIGNRDSGRYDGWVFGSPLEFWSEFAAVGFKKEKFDVTGASLWVTAKK
jgi:ubiquinone/menaquinone biosynthesis C-methylase UbiE